MCTQCTCRHVLTVLTHFLSPAGANPDDFHGATVIYNRTILPSDVADGSVAIAVFERETSKGAINVSEPTRKLYVFHHHQRLRCHVGDPLPQLCRSNGTVGQVQLFRNDDDAGSVPGRSAASHARAQ